MTAARPSTDRSPVPAGDTADQRAARGVRMLATSVGVKLALENRTKRWEAKRAPLPNRNSMVAPSTTILRPPTWREWAAALAIAIAVSGLVWSVATIN